MKNTFKQNLTESIGEFVGASLDGAGLLIAGAVICAIVGLILAIVARGVGNMNKDYRIPLWRLVIITAFLTGAILGLFWR